MKNFWKVLGIAALAVGLTPYKVEKDEETGENKYQALLWQASRAPKAEGEGKGEINITLGFNSPFQEEEAHLFSEDLSVEYAVPKAETASEAVETEGKEVPAGEAETAGAEETAPVEETEAAAEEPESAAGEEPAAESAEPSQP